MISVQPYFLFRKIPIIGISARMVGRKTDVKTDTVLILSSNSLWFRYRCNFMTPVIRFAKKY